MWVGQVIEGLQWAGEVLLESASNELLDIALKKRRTLPPLLASIVVYIFAKTTKSTDSFWTYLWSKVWVSVSIYQNPASLL